MAREIPENQDKAVESENSGRMESAHGKSYSRSERWGIVMMEPGTDSLDGLSQEV